MSPLRRTGFFRRPALLLLLTGALPALLPAQPASLRVQKLSPAGHANSDVLALNGRSRISSDGKWVLFFDDADTNNVEDLYSVSRFGGAAVRLSAVRPPGSDFVFSDSIQLTPDDRRVIFELDQETLGRNELWSVPIQGPAAAGVKLSPNLPVAAEVASTAILSADGQYVGFQFQVPGDRIEAWSAPVDGSGPAFRMHGDYPAGAAGIVHWAVSGTRTYFIADLATPGQLELWSTPLDGSTGPVRLNGSLIAFGDVEDFTVTPDEQRVLYFADQRFDERIELYSAPAAGPFSAAVRVSPTFPATADVTQAMTSEDSSRALFLADSSVDEQFELWSVPIEGPSSAAVKLNGSLVAGGDVDFSIDELDGMVTYLADATVDEKHELFLVPVDGPSSAAVPAKGASRFSAADFSGSMIRLRPGSHGPL